MDGNYTSEEVAEWGTDIHVSNIAPDNITALRSTYLKEGLTGAVDHLRSYYSCSLVEGTNIIKRITKDLPSKVDFLAILQNIPNKELLAEARRRGLV